MYVCLFVCLSIGSHVSKPHIQTTTVSVSVNCGRGLILLLRQCNTLCIYGSVDNVIISHNGPIREMKDDVIFPPVRQLAAPKAKLHSTIACWNLSAAVDKISTDIVRRAVPLR